MEKAYHRSEREIIVFLRTPWTYSFLKIWVYKWWGNEFILEEELHTN